MSFLYQETILMCSFTMKRRRFAQRRNFASVPPRPPIPPSPPPFLPRHAV